MMISDKRTDSERLIAIETKMDTVVASVASIVGKIDDSALKIKGLETEMGMVKTVAKWIFSPLLGAIVVATAWLAMR